MSKNLNDRYKPQPQPTSKVLYIEDVTDPNVSGVTCHWSFLRFTEFCNRSVLIA